MKDGGARSGGKKPHQLQLLDLKGLRFKSVKK